jgi:hypothetical protein
MPPAPLVWPTPMNPLWRVLLWVSISFWGFVLAFGFWFLIFSLLGAQH